MRVAVVVPTKDGAARIGACLDALARQTRVPDELVVVDNGSTDGTADVVRSRGARVVHEPVTGSYAARNRGLADTTAEVVAFTDDDCEPEPEWLERLVAAFDDEGVVGAGGEIVAASEPASVAERWARERDVLSQASHWRHGYLPFFATANAAYRRSALDAVGGFEPALRSGGDVDVAWRVQTATGGRLAFVPEARVRHHHRTSLRGLLRQQRSYARGNGRLDRRWGGDPRYRAVAGTPAARLRAVWLLPGRLAVRVVRRRPLWLPMVDAAVRVVHEWGRREGHGDPPIELVAAHRGGGR